MNLRSPPGMKGPCPCRPGALTRRCERPGASTIFSPKGIFTVTRQGEGNRPYPLIAHLRGNPS